jgi:hypothetical protein
VLNYDPKLGCRRPGVLIAMEEQCFFLHGPTAKCFVFLLYERYSADRLISHARSISAPVRPEIEHGSAASAERSHLAVS